MSEMQPMGYDSAEPSRPSQMMGELERQSLMLSDLQDVTQQLERRLAPVMMDTSKVASEQLAEARELLAPMPEMVRNGTDVLFVCVTRLRTILNTLEV